MIGPARDPNAPVGTGPLPADAAIAVTPHYLASEAALRVIKNGGTAVDGAIAADATLAVVAPDTCGPGGDLFAIVHRPGDDRPTVLNASGRAGSGASAALLREQGHTSIPMRSRWSITVPGCVDGWEALVDRFSNLTLADDLAPAIEYAREGFPTSIELASSLERIKELIGDQASAASLYPGGATPPIGAILNRPALGQTLEGIGDVGRDSFYLGDVGAGIIDATRGAIVREDLERRQVEWVEAASAKIFGLTAWTVPPNSQGWLTLATLRIFEMLDPPRDPFDPAFQHALIEAYRSVAWERADTTSDPDSAPFSPEHLLDPERLAARAALVDPTQRVDGSRHRRHPAGLHTSPPVTTTAWSCRSSSPTSGALAVATRPVPPVSGSTIGAPVSTSVPVIRMNSPLDAGHCTRSPRRCGRTRIGHDSCSARAAAISNPNSWHR